MLPPEPAEAPAQALACFVPHPYILAFRRVATGIAGFLFCLTWLIPLSGLLYGLTISFAVVRLALSLSFTLIAVLLLILYAVREITALRIEIYKDRIIKYSRKRATVVLYRSITSFAHAPGLKPAGFLLLATSKSRLSIEPIYARLGHLVELLEQQLRTHGEESIFDEYTMGLARIEARLRDESTDRLCRLFRLLPATMLLFFALGFVSAQHFWGFPLFLSVGWALLSTVVPPAVFALSDILLTKSARKALRYGSDRQEYFWEIVSWMAFLVFSAYLVLGIAVRNVFFALVYR